MKCLVVSIKNSGRNLSKDSYYTSVELAVELYEDFGCTVLGTMQSNEKHIPEELKATAGRVIFSSVFAFTHPSSESQ